MWPWGHLAVGYLCYSALARWRFNRAPDDAAALAVVFGTQFPDLVDKPLAWTFFLLPSGRSLAHSLLTATVVCALAFWIAHRRNRLSVATAFTVGYVTHLFTDAISPLLDGEYAYVSYLGWPLFEQPPYDTNKGFAEHFADLTLTPFTLVGVAFVAFAVAVWLRDGRPGLATVRGWVGSSIAQEP